MSPSKSVRVNPPPEAITIKSGNMFYRALATDLRDGSLAGQVAADYFLSSAWTVGAVVDFNGGRARSNFGSLPQDVSILVRVSRYFR